MIGIIIRGFLENDTTPDSGKASHKDVQKKYEREET